MVWNYQATIKKPEEGQILKTCSPSSLVNIYSKCDYIEYNLGINLPHTWANAACLVWTNLRLGLGYNNKLKIVVIIDTNNINQKL